jgi:hypothetical protein
MSRLESEVAAMEYLRRVRGKRMYVMGAVRAVAAIAKLMMGGRHG